MFKNWLTKDEIETSIRTFQSVPDEMENTFSKIEWRDDENGRKNLITTIKIWYNNNNSKNIIRMSIYFLMFKGPMKCKCMLICADL